MVKKKVSSVFLVADVFGLQSKTEILSDIQRICGRTHPIRVSQISKISGPTVFCVLLNERKVVRPSWGILRVIFHVGHWSGG